MVLITSNINLLETHDNSYDTKVILRKDKSGWGKIVQKVGSGPSLTGYISYV